MAIKQFSHEHLRPKDQPLGAPRSSAGSGLLQRIKQVFDNELPGSDEFTEDEFAELREIDRRRKAGLDTYLSVEDAMRMIREGRAA